MYIKYKTNINYINLVITIQNNTHIVNMLFEGHNYYTPNEASRCHTFHKSVLKQRFYILQTQRQHYNTSILQLSRSISLTCNHTKIFYLAMVDKQDLQTFQKPTTLLRS